METKVCKGCNNTKPTNEFYGGRNKCIVCYRKERNEHRKKNKDSINEKGREYYYSNHDKMLEKRKNYREGENKERVSNYNKEYLKTYEKNRVKSDKLYEIRRTIRNVIKGSLYKKGYTENSKTYKILGCSYEEFKSHIESQWEEWMNWDNYGKCNGKEKYGWDFDHIIPLSSVTTEEDIIKLNHYSNIQPLCSYVNRYIKKNKII